MRVREPVMPLDSGLPARVPAILFGQANQCILARVPHASDHSRTSQSPAHLAPCLQTHFLQSIAPLARYSPSGRWSSLMGIASRSLEGRGR